MRDLPRPGLEPVSPALAGRFSTTAPPGKPGTLSYIQNHGMFAEPFLWLKSCTVCRTLASIKSLNVCRTSLLIIMECLQSFLVCIDPRNVSWTHFFFFFFFWLCCVFVAVCGLSLVVASGGYSLLRCAGFSLRRLLLLRSTGSRHAGFSSCGTWAQ